MYYGSKKSFRYCVIVYLSYLSIFAGFEAGVIYGARALIVRPFTRLTRLPITLTLQL